MFGNSSVQQDLIDVENVTGIKYSVNVYRGLIWQFSETWQLQWLFMFYCLIRRHLLRLVMRLISSSPIACIFRFLSMLKRILFQRIMYKKKGVDICWMSFVTLNINNLMSKSMQFLMLGQIRSGLRQIEMQVSWVKSI